MKYFRITYANSILSSMNYILLTSTLSVFGKALIRFRVLTAGITGEGDLDLSDDFGTQRLLLYPSFIARTYGACTIVAPVVSSISSSEETKHLLFFFCE